jgi:hypothetical protein
VEARAAYDADVARAQGEVSAAAARGVTLTLSVVPFVDPGQVVRDGAVAEFEAAKAALAGQAQVCADLVRAGCADAPEKPGWFESGLRFVGGILEGAGEAIWDLMTMVPFSPVNMVMDGYKVASGELTTEELRVKYDLAVDDAVSMVEVVYTGLTTDPVGFGREMGKSMLDWDTWADDPARAIGHLVPDAVIAAATGGAGAAASRTANLGADAADALTDLGKLRHLNDIDDLESLPDLRRGADLGEITPGDPSLPEVESWLGDINPNYASDPFDPRWSENCGSCTLAVFKRFDGELDVIATDKTFSIPEMENATGLRQVSLSPEDIAQKLIEQGPGSHTVIGIDREVGPGHWFNAVYDGERVYAVDGQTNRIHDWPPDFGPVSNWDAGIRERKADGGAR